MPLDDGVVNPPRGETGMRDTVIELVNLQCFILIYYR